MRRLAPRRWDAGSEQARRGQRRRACGLSSGRLQQAILLLVVLTGERVGHDVLETGDVGDVRRELADESELVSLPIRRGCGL